MSGKNREREIRLRMADGVQGYDPFDGLHQIAKRECAKTGSVTSYPANFIEFHDVAATSGLSRTICGVDLEYARRQLSHGIPVGELTRSDGKSVIEYDPRYRLNKAA